MVEVPDNLNFSQTNVASSDTTALALIQKDTSQAVAMMDTRSAIISEADRQLAMLLANDIGLTMGALPANSPTRQEYTALVEPLLQKVADPRTPEVTATIFILAGLHRVENVHRRMRAEIALNSSQDVKIGLAKIIDAAMAQYETTGIQFENRDTATAALDRLLQGSVPIMTPVESKSATLFLTMPRAPEQQQTWNNRLDTIYKAFDLDKRKNDDREMPPMLRHDALRAAAECDNNLADTLIDLLVHSGILDRVALPSEGLFYGIHASILAVLQKKYPPMIAAPRIP